MSVRVGRTAGIALATWVVLAAVWMLLVDNESLPELLTGAGVAIIATLGSELVRAQRITKLAVRPIWLVRLWRPLARIPLDTGIVMWALGRQLLERRPERGALRAMRFRAVGDDAGDNARRALVEATGSMAPNTIVIGVDKRRRLVLAHQLVPRERVESVLDPLELR